jgi:hypothetical protein
MSETSKNHCQEPKVPVFFWRWGPAAVPMFPLGDDMGDYL